MPDPTPINDDEILATLALLGEATAEEREKLKTLLDQDPDFAAEQAQLQALAKTLQDSVPDADFALPENVLASLEENRIEALRQAGAAAESLKVIPFTKRRVFLYAIAAALILGIFFFFTPSTPDSGFVIASHADAMEMARTYPTTVTKGLEDSTALDHHKTLLGYLEDLERSGKTEEALEILAALPDFARGLPEFRRLILALQEK